MRSIRRRPAGCHVEFFNARYQHRRRCETERSAKHGKDEHVLAEEH